MSFPPPNSPEIATDATNKTQGKRPDIWTAIFDCLEVEPKVDYKKLAERMGYKSPHVARNAYVAAKDKLLKTTHKPPAVAKAPKATKGAKMKPTANKDGVVKRTTRGRKAQTKETKEEVEEEDGGGSKEKKNVEVNQEGKGA